MWGLINTPASHPNLTCPTAPLPTLFNTILQHQPTQSLFLKIALLIHAALQILPLGCTKLLQNATSHSTQYHVVHCHYSSWSNEPERILRSPPFPNEPLSRPQGFHHPHSHKVGLSAAQQSLPAPTPTLQPKQHLGKRPYVIVVMDRFALERSS